VHDILDESVNAHKVHLKFFGDLQSEHFPKYTDFGFKKKYESIMLDFENIHGRGDKAKIFELLENCGKNGQQVEFLFNENYFAQCWCLEIVQMFIDHKEPKNWFHTLTIRGRIYEYVGTLR
jgi:hypothetical protein